MLEILQLLYLLMPLFLIVFIISIFYRSFIEKQKLRKAGMTEIDVMNGFKFESYLAELFKVLGYKVKQTPSRGDFGADLIVVKDEKTIAIQAKRYKKNVGVKAVQEIQAAKSYYNTDEAWVITNSGYTEAAIEMAKKVNVRLIGRRGLTQLILNSKAIREGKGVVTVKKVT